MFNSKLKHRVLSLQWELEQASYNEDKLSRENSLLKEQLEALSIQKDPRHSVGAIDYIVYENKVLSKIGNAFLSGTDNPAFKLGIQFALRHFEKELVVGR